MQNRSFLCRNNTVPVFYFLIEVYLALIALYSTPVAMLCPLSVWLRGQYVGVLHSTCNPIRHRSRCTAKGWRDTPLLREQTRLFSFCMGHELRFLTRRRTFFPLKKAASKKKITLFFKHKRDSCSFHNNKTPNELSSKKKSMPAEHF